MKKINLMLASILAGMLILTACTENSEQKTKKTPVDYANPYIGNISHLLVPTYPTVHLPNSMLRFYPERREHTSDQVAGLPVIVTSHRGSSAFNISPVNSISEGVEAVKMYSYDNEKITPYRYQVYLDEEMVNVDYAPSHQSAVYSITFEQDGENCLIINTRNGAIQYDEQGLSGFQIINNGPTRVYIYMETEQTPVKVGVVENNTINFDSKSAEGRDKALALSFDEKK